MRSTTRLLSLDTESESTSPPNLSGSLCPPHPNTWMPFPLPLSAMGKCTRTRKGWSRCRQRATTSGKVQAAQSLYVPSRSHPLPLLIMLQTQIEEWLEHRDEFTDELMRHEGLPGSPGPSPCGLCPEPNAIYRCLDCSFRSMLCQDCIVATHRSEPLHSIQVWFASSFPSPSRLTDTSRNGQASFSPGSHCVILVPRISLAIRLAKDVHCLPLPWISPSSTSPALKLFAFATATVGPLDSNYGLVSNFFVRGGFRQR